MLKMEIWKILLSIVLIVYAAFHLRKHTEK